MKKKIIIIISLILVVAIIVGIIKFTKYDSNYTGKIIKIDDNAIFIEDTSKLEEYKDCQIIEETNYGYDIITNEGFNVQVSCKYFIYINDIKIIDKNGKTIHSSDLNIGDTIRITTKKRSYTSYCYYS
jgi:hypothetical protein